MGLIISSSSSEERKITKPYCFFVTVGLVDTFIRGLQMNEIKRRGKNRNGKRLFFHARHRACYFFVHGRPCFKHYSVARENSYE